MINRREACFHDSFPIKPSVHRKEFIKMIHFPMTDKELKERYYKLKTKLQMTHEETLRYLLDSLDQYKEAIRESWIKRRTKLTIEMK